jgi:hypothetical protein
LTGEKKSASGGPHEALFWRSGKNHAVRKGDFKLVKMGDNTGLYDLASDISEAKDLKAEKPDVLKEMQDAYERWNSQMIDPVWTIQRRKRKPTKTKKKT